MAVKPVLVIHGGAGAIRREGLVEFWDTKMKI